MKLKIPKRFTLKTLAVVAANVCLATAALAQNGTWTNLNGGSWANSANWQNGVIAGVGGVADFSTLDLSADTTVTLDGFQYAGGLVFGDLGDGHNWIVNAGSAGSLEVIDAPETITVNNESTTIDAPVLGIQGLTKAGNGTLIFATPLAIDGGATNAAGTWEFLASVNTTNNFAAYDPLVISGGVVESAGTFNLDVSQNNDNGSTNVFGPGTLRLAATTNGPTSPDLFFCPDAVGNDYYGAALASGVLDLGSSQRYIYALTEHNAVARYDPWEDARIDSDIVGSGGITYIAQNTYPGGFSMECQLVLAGTNSFTGMVEIQRGSIYVFTPFALAQTNKLLMDPTNGNNARLFLYGNGATVENLESSGGGTSLIANGNVNNTIYVAAATLTVAETSNTVFNGSLVDGQYEYDDGNIPPGSLSLVKTGSGTLTIIGTNTYTGSTTVADGGLIIPATSSGGGAFSVADGATLGVAGIDANKVTMTDLALGVSGATTLSFSFASRPATFLAPITTGSLEANGGANSVTINIFTNNTGMPVGQYPLIQFNDGSIGGSGAGFGAFHLGTLPAGVVASLVNDMTNNSIDLNVTTGTAAPSQNGVWISSAGGSWENSADWQNGGVAQGIGYTADFSTLSLSADATVTLDGALSIGNVYFGDKADAHNWTLATGSGGPLTLRTAAGVPNIAVSNETATISVPLAGTQGLNQSGNGVLVLAQPAGYSGATTNESGTLEFLAGANTFNNSTYISPLVINGVVESAATLNLDVNQNNDEGSTNVLGAGTLRLIGTTNGAASPDLFFCPDAVANDYYGAAIANSVLDLGSSQRFIYALTEHDAVAEYDPYEDARIDANIIGSGGITYIAQNTYGGAYPMECPLVLAGTNSFTGMMEIQRGSIYLFNPLALAQTNKLLLDPSGTNNARLFLYGNGATVANLESTGAGTPLIANGNVNNPITVNPATLTVIETSNTTFAGAILDGQYEYDGGGIAPGSLSIAKSGAGVLTLAGPNGYTGSTYVASGELEVAAPQTNGCSYSVANGATLGIVGIDTNSVLMADLSLSNSVIALTFTGAPTNTLAPITTTSIEANGAANSVTINIYGPSLPVGEFPLIKYASGAIGGSGVGFGAFHLGALPAGTEAALVNNAANDSIDLNVTTAAPPLPVISGGQIATNGAFAVSLTGVQGTPFTVHSTTNLALRPLSAWKVVGGGTVGSGITVFDDPSAITNSEQFYLISSP